ncbi:MAG: hypothetical protein Q9160_003781 [Pyrenula sp. 1 TL-2023]
MDSREIQNISHNIQKAIQAKEPTDNVLALLQRLKKEVKATEDVLRSTGIGKSINKLKAHPTPDIARLASEIVSKWRNEVNAQKLRSSGTSTPTNGVKASASSTNGTRSPAPQAQQPASKPPSKPSIPPEKRSRATDKVKFPILDDKARDACLGMLYDGLAPFSTLPSNEILSVAKSIESAGFAQYGTDPSSDAPAPAYREKFRSLYQNLRNKSNPGLRTRVLKGDISPHRFINMTHEELKSKEQREEDRKINKENMDKAMVAQEEKSISTSLQCGKCKEKKVSYSQAQTRSADEPMTTFCECQVCGNRWKFS